MSSHPGSSIANLIGRPTVADRAVPAAHTGPALMLTVGLGVWLAAVARVGGSPSTLAAVVVVAGAGALAALLAASMRLRSTRAASFTSWQRDPFLAFSAALMVLLAPHAVALWDLPTSRALEPSTWLIGCVAAALASAGFITLMRDVVPGRTLDAVFLAAIGATGAGLAAWAVVLHRLEGTGGLARPVLEALAPPVVDLFAIGLGLQARRVRERAQFGTLFFLLGWTLVLAADVTRLLEQAANGSPAARPAAVLLVLVCGCFAASALHPDSTHSLEPFRSPMARLSWMQVVLLGAAVLLGPSIFALGVHAPGQRSVVLPLSAALSLLVVAYLVRLVQGRALLEHRAHHDELTGLANRTLFQDRAAVAIAHARRTNGHSAVLFLDLDRFKNVNDSLGHAVGNRLLQAVAKRLQGATRGEDTVARLGGDEFVVFLPQLDDPGEAAAVAAKILERFERPFTLGSHQLFASPSIGIALFPADGHDADALLENADIAMYRAKQQGRKTFCTYDRSMNDHAHERLALESQLHTAIERGELRLHYQPKIHIPTGRVTGMEALLRWEHPTLGLLQPLEFIPLAEECGLITSIGEWALEQACWQNQQWKTAGFAPLVVAVNISLRQFQQQQIEDVVARVLRATSLDPGLLELEVTESLAMHDPEAISATLHDLRRLGVTCSIDDFGTGYSGLSNLIGFPIDKLKIDKSFVASIASDREAPIVVAVVALAHGLGLQVVAEGVETAEQLERLRELGCDEMQGYFFSPPVSSERFEQLLMLESVAQGPGRLHAVRPDLVISLGS
ncbi:MAG: putative bifunctional diguanylate cyclase/phosphodiesterase [Microthrixaceae bacterium]